MSTDGKDLEQEVRRRALELRPEIEFDTLEAITAMVAEAESLEELKALFAEIDDIAATDEMVMTLWRVKDADEGSTIEVKSVLGSHKTPRLGPKFATGRQKDQQQAERYLNLQRQREEDRQAASAEKFRKLDSYFKAPVESLDYHKGGADDEMDTHPDNVEETKKTLRTMGWPITLFGETDSGRAKRLHALQLSLDDDRERGEVNVLQHEMKKEARGERDVCSSDEDEEGDATLERDVLAWIRLMFKAWLIKFESAANTDEKSVANQKQEKGKYRQARQYMRPLRRLLRASRLTPDVLQHLADIARLSRERKHQEANAEYMRLAIGNAAWPVGVTGTSIHARPAESRITESSQVAHVLNDETSRKYLQMVKRLITLAEELDS
eukprot:GEMP01048922.1.p1 GENE.GEMP01048922.1~~GEMP01048922.1.p1  ORF type:complete len:382 (+),score=94.78 GEMP01048922.1:180-1325(+)